MEPANQGEQGKPIIPKDKSNFKQTTLDSFFKKGTKPQEQSPHKSSANEEAKIDRTEPQTTGGNSSSEQASAQNKKNIPVTTSEEVKRDEMPTSTSEKADSKVDTSTTTKLDSDSKKFYIFPHKSTNWTFIKSQLELLSAGTADQETFFGILNQFANIHLNTKDEKNNFNLLRKAMASFSGFFEEIVPFMATHALKADKLFPEEVPILRQSEKGILFLNKAQCACLLFHMFFCTTVSQANTLLPKTYSLIEWYNTTSPHKNPRDAAKIAKLECFLNYARRMKAHLPETETISIERVCLDTNTDYGANSWSKASELLSEVVMKEGSIQEAKGALQIDFANRFLGGGVLRTGCVQEEITFAIAPEHIIGILFTECLLSYEAAVIKGAQEYSKHVGYGDSFRFNGDFESEKIPADEFGRLDIVTVAIDAMNFRMGDPNNQFKLENVLREMNKALVGFRGPVIDKTADADGKKDVATGRWGCGAYKGDPQLKLVIQWLACSRVKRRMLFYPLGDKSLALAPELSKKFAGKTTGELFNAVLAFINETSGPKELKLLGYLFSDKVKL